MAATLARAASRLPANRHAEDPRWVLSGTVERVWKFAD
jgi:hypothetical protein